MSELKITGDVCVRCSKVVRFTDFTDNLSRKEFEISHFCQTCQDNIFEYLEEQDMVASSKRYASSEARDRNYERHLDRVETNCAGSGSIDDLKKEQSMNLEWDIKKILRLEKNCFLTGSRAWDMHHKSSDYDFICDKDAFTIIMRRLNKKNLNYIENEHYNSIYISDQLGLYNIICLNDFDLSCWKFATKSVKGMVLQEALPSSFFQDKNKVYGLFEILKGASRFIDISPDPWDEF